ncbi:MAG: stage III sporulation protein AE [Firmicutes bacterium]|nr:stage III sporulation protein AE [Bacillota bacterium]
MHHERENRLRSFLLIGFMVLVIAALVFFPLRTRAQEEIGGEMEERAGVVDLEFMGDYWREVEQEAGEYFPEIHWYDALAWFKPGGGGPDLREIPGGLMRFLFKEVLLNVQFLGKLLVLAVGAAFLKNLETAFESRNVAWVTRGVILLVLIALILPGFMAAMELARDTVNNMVDFILSLVPVLIVLLSSLGSFSAAKLFQPAVIFGVNFFSAAIRNFVFPLIFFSTVLALVHTISPRLRVDGLAKFFRDICSWALGLILVLFITLVCVKGLTGMVGDAVTLKTAKYLSSTFIPVIGKVLSDAAETVVGTTLLFKNSAALSGIIILIMLALFPLLKMFVLFFIYRMAAVMVQIVGESNLGDCLNAMGDGLMLVIASLAGATLVFFIAVVVIVAAGNLSIVMR